MATSFKLKIKDYNDDGRIVTIGEKTVYNLDGMDSAADWVREQVKGMDTVKEVQLSNAIEINEKKEFGCVLKENNLGYFYNDSNRVSQNPTNVALFSAAFAHGHGTPIGHVNLDRVIALFTARRLISPEFHNTCDEYMVPNIQHPDYQQFVNDALIFSLFHSAGLFSSLRSITYKGKTHNIFNQFFFMSSEEMKTLAITHNFTDLYNDVIAHGSSDRFVYNYLKSLKLSPDAQSVLDAARDLVRLSFPLRQAAHDIKPEFHLNTFDAGWYQIRNGILKDSFKDQYKAFTDSYKAFADRLRPLVYELGFLRK